MPHAIDVRPFRRDDRAQLTDLVNAHIGAVLPGVSVSPNAVLGQLEREPGEYVVDPWAVERATLVAVQRDRLTAAAHLVRYGADERVSESYRGVGEVRWLIGWPQDAAAADAVAAAALGQLERWGVRAAYADGALPVPGLYGVPDAWPHVRAAYERAGFAHPADGRVELVLLAEVGALGAPGPAPLGGLTVERQLGGAATRFDARLDGATVAFIEVHADLTAGGTLSRLAGWAEVEDLHVAGDLRRRGLATWLLGHAADWLRLAGARLLLHYEIEGEDQGGRAFALASGVRLLARTRRGYAWVPAAGRAGSS